LNPLALLFLLIRLDALFQRGKSFVGSPGDLEPLAAQLVRGNKKLLDLFGQ